MDNHHPSLLVTVSIVFLKIQQHDDTLDSASEKACFQFSKEGSVFRRFYVKAGTNILMAVMHGYSTQKER